MRITKPYTIGFIGCGHMGMAMAKGCANKNYIDRTNILIYDHHEETKTVALANRFGIASSEEEVAAKAHFVILAVRPSQADAVLATLAKTKVDCLVSVVTGLSISYMEGILGSDTPIIRAMPNTPLQIFEGASALCKNAATSADAYDFIFQMFGELGTVRTIAEDKMNDVIAVSGSTPAYFYYFLECIINDAVDHGIAYEDARALAVKTMIGAGKLVLENPEKSLATFVDEVASKGGTTIEAITSMRSDHLEDIVKKANAKCVQRAKELSK